VTVIEQDIVGGGPSGRNGGFLTGWWESLPGALADLSSPGVLLTVGGFYVLELAAERWPPTALIWNAFHAIIRPVSGALLALLLLDGQPTQTALLGAAFSGVVASAAHATEAAPANDVTTVA